MEHWIVQMEYFPNHIAHGSIFEKTEENEKERKVILLKVLDLLRTVKRIFHDQNQLHMRRSVFVRMRWTTLKAQMTRDIKRTLTQYHFYVHL